MSEYKEMVKDGVKNIGNRVKKFFLYVAGFILFGFISYLVICNFTIVTVPVQVIWLKLLKRGIFLKPMKVP